MKENKLTFLLLPALLWIIYFYLNTKNDTSDLNIFLILNILISVSFLIFVFFQNIKELFKNAKEDTSQQTKHATEKDVYELLFKIVEEKLCNHVIKPFGIIHNRTHHFGSSLIYEFKLRLLHSEYSNGKVVEFPEVVIIIDSTDLTKLPTILKNTSEKAIQKAITRINKLQYSTSQATEQKPQPSQQPIIKENHYQHIMQKQPEEEKKKENTEKLV